MYCSLKSRAHALFRSLDAAKYCLTADEGSAARAWDEAVDAARVELCGKAPFVTAEAFGLIDFLGVDRGDLPVFPIIRRVG